MNMIQKNKFEKLTGIAVPLGALYTKDSPCIGEFTSLKKFSNFCYESGLKIIQLLPVNDTGTQSSPYSGLSAFALHPIYVNISCIEGFDELYKGDTSFKKSYDAFIKKFSYTSRFNYQEILNSKIELLRQIYNQTELSKSCKINSEIKKWITKNPWIKEYSVYKNLKWQNLQSSWKEWEKKDQLLSPEEIEKRFDDKELKKEHLFYVWTQIQLNKQFLDASEYVKSLGIILKGDMPILMNEDSCDAWAHPEFFNHSLRAGSPVDGENPCGQNWGFPTYNWKNLKENDYLWWKNRLITASQFYQAYRLDHILGFFRIWAIPERDSTAILGHAEPYASVSRKVLNQNGFEDDRLRWLSQPHVKTSDIDYFTWNQQKSHEILKQFCEKLDSEELWLFKKEIKGDKDIYDFDLSKFCESKETCDKIKQCLAEYWNNRTLIEIKKNQFILVWSYSQTYPWSTLSSDEQKLLEKIFEKNDIAQNKLWKAQATDIFKNITSCVKMQPCGEDLGVGLPCVPSVMSDENIFGLNVVRWSRYWEKENQPYVEYDKYRKLSVTTTSVHDSSTIRQWWQDEFDSALKFVQSNIQDFEKIIDDEKIDDPQFLNQLKNFTPEIAESILCSVAKANSLWCIHPLQDFLYMDLDYWLCDPKDERINIPGEVSEFNWTYRMPCLVEKLITNKKLIKKIKSIVKIHESEE